MKHLLLFTLLVFVCKVNSQNAQKKAQLFIELRDAVDSSKFNNYASFTIKNSSGQHLVFESFHSAYLIDILVDIGHSTLINARDSVNFDTINLNIDLPVTKEVKLYNNFRDNKAFKYHLLDSLSIGESFTLHYHTSGCFHYGNDSIVFNRVADNYIITYHDNTKILSEAELKLVNTFFNQLTDVQDGYCTTHDTYHFIYQNKHFYISDNTCVTDSYYYLIKALYGDKAYRKIITDE